MSDKDVILGICRFSFLGRGDWVLFRENKDVSPERLEKIAVDLYEENRLKARFEAFQKICLPSILAQTDPRFIFVVLSSPRMPEYWRNRLTEICEPHDQIMLVWSDATDTDSALRETLHECHDLSDGQLWQFRLDDDDAIAVGYIARLRSHIARMKSIQECAISIARGLFVTLYEGRKTQYLEYKKPFESTGTCLKARNRDHSVFSFGHFSLRDRFTNFVDFQGTSALLLKWPSDSKIYETDPLPRGIRILERYEYMEKIRSHFPFLEHTDLEALRFPQPTRPT